MMCDRMKIFTLSKGCQIYVSQIYMSDIKQYPYTYTLYIYIYIYKSIRTMGKGFGIYMKSNNIRGENNLVM